MNEIIELCKKSMKDCKTHFENELKKMRMGKAQVSILDDISVSYYGKSTPINQIASITLSDPKTIMIKPWEKHLLQDIEKSILKSDLDLIPKNDGMQLCIVIPPFSEEQRKKVAKRIKKEAEETKICIRNHRKQANNSFKNLAGASEDEIKLSQDRIQKLTDENIKEVDAILVRKEAEVMKI